MQVFFSNLSRHETDGLITMAWGYLLSGALAQENKSLAPHYLVDCAYFYPDEIRSELNWKKLHTTGTSDVVRVVALELWLDHEPDTKSADNWRAPPS